MGDERLRGTCEDGKEEIAESLRRVVCVEGVEQHKSTALSSDVRQE